MQPAIPILSTKISVPRRRHDLLTRQRLLDILSDQLDNRLVILAAPAGYGKTSLLIDFAHHTEWPFCWYTLDDLDREPLRFIFYLIASISAQFSGFGIRSSSVLQSMSQGELDLDSAAVVIANDIQEHIREHFVVVIDDYHLVDSVEGISAFLSRLLQLVDENFHLVLASRKLISLPDLPLLVARGQVGGLSFDDLAFAPFEIQALMLQNYHLLLSDAEAQAAARNVEGWITGLLLGAQIRRPDGSIRLGVGRPNNIGLYDFLAEQVLDTQPPEIKDFLLRSSLLEEIDASLCEATLAFLYPEPQNWDELIQEIFAQNLFVIPVGEERVFLRYHNLFRDFLQATLLKTRPEEAKAILNRVVDAYNREGQWERSYHLVRQMGTTEELAALIRQVGTHLIARGRVMVLEEWLNSLPEAAFRQDAALLSLRGGVAMKRGDPRVSLEYFRQAVDQLRESDDPYALAETLIRRSSVLRSLGDYPAAQSDAEEALTLTENRADLRPLHAEALRVRGTNAYLKGNLKEALAYQEQSLAEYQSLGDELSSAQLLVEVGLTYTSLGQYVSAEHAYSRSLKYWQSAGNVTWLANVYNNLGDLQRLLGNYEAALENLEKAVEQARQTGYLRLEAYALASIGDLYTDMDSLPQAMDAYQQARGLLNQLQENWLSVYVCLKEAFLNALQGQGVASGQLFAEAARLAKSHDSAYELHLCRLEEAKVSLLRKDFETAVQAAEPCVKFFNDNGQHVEGLQAGIIAAAARWHRGSTAGAAGRDQVVADMKLALEQASGLNLRKAMLPLIRRMMPLLEPIVEEPALEPYGLFFKAEAAEFEKRNFALKRQIRRQMITVPIAPARLIIRALGRPRVSLNEREIRGDDWMSQTARDLFFFLLAHQDGVTKEMVGETFWPGSAPGELKLRFKNALYRVRNALGKDVILYEGETYRFNTEQDYDYDVESFYREIYHAERADEPARKVQYYQAALQHYQGPYVPDGEGTWFSVERQRLTQVYLSVLVELGRNALEMNDYTTVISACQRAVAEDPCMEEAHRLAMLAYAGMGNRAGVARQYELCKQALAEELDIRPSDQTEQLYRRLTA